MNERAREMLRDRAYGVCEARERRKGGHTRASRDSDIMQHLIARTEILTPGSRAINPDAEFERMRVSGGRTDGPESVRDRERASLHARSPRLLLNLWAGGLLSLVQGIEEREQRL